MPVINQRQLLQHWLGIIQSLIRITLSPSQAHLVIQFLIPRVTGLVPPVAAGEANPYVAINREVMRLSEKTLEINICSQLEWFPSPLNACFQFPRCFWFGLTQAQEAKAGFDACTRLGGRLLVLQFKASNYILRNGARRFRAPHNQLTALQARLRGQRRAIYYVLPNLGTTGELPKNKYLIPLTWLLDVANVPQLNPPTTPQGLLRKSGLHYIDLIAGNRSAIIRSEPVTVPVYSIEDIFGRETNETNFGLHIESVEELHWYGHTLGRNAVALIIP